MKKILSVSFLVLGFASVIFLLICVCVELGVIRENMEQSRIAQQLQDTTNQDDIDATTETRDVNEPLPPGVERYPIMKGSYCFTGNTVVDHGVTEAEIVFGNGFTVKIPVPSDWVLEPVCKVNTL